MTRITNTHRKDTPMPISDRPPGDDWATSPFPTFTPEQIAEIVAASPTAEVAADLGIEIARTVEGGTLAWCPWCRVQRFLILPGGSWRCDGCTEQGRDVIVLVAKMRDLWRADAVAWLDWRLSGGANRTEVEP
jgi:hypothetical protein